MTERERSEPIEQHVAELLGARWNRHADSVSVSAARSSLGIVVPSPGGQNVHFRVEPCAIKVDVGAEHVPFCAGRTCQVSVAPSLGDLEEIRWIDRAAHELLTALEADSEVERFLQPEGDNRAIWITAAESEPGGARSYQAVDEGLTPADLAGGCVEAPLVFVRLSSNCLGNCIFCDPVRSYRIPWHTAERWVRWLSEVRFRAKRVVVCGQEPVTFPMVDQIVEHLRDQGVGDIVLPVSGVALTRPGLLHRLIDSGVTAIEVPVYSHEPPIHDHVVGVSGSWDSTVRGIECLLPDERCRIRAFGAVLQPNLASLDATTDWLSAHFGLHYCAGVVRMKRRSRALGYHRLVPSWPEIRDCVRHTPLIGFPLCRIAPAVPLDRLSANEGLALMARSFLVQPLRYPAECSACRRQEQCPGVLDDYPAGESVAPFR